MTEEELDLYKRLQPVFEKKMGPWQVGDWYYDSFVAGGMVACIERHDMSWSANSSILRLPLPIDPRNPERGLLGMLNKDAQFFSGLGENFVRYYDPIDSYCYLLVEGATPTLALIKALAAQEGV